MSKKGIGKGWHYKYPEHALAAKGIRSKIKLPKGMKTSGVPSTDFTSVKFRNKITGEIKTQIPIFELKNYEKLSDYENKNKLPELPSEKQQDNFYKEVAKLQVEEAYYKMDEPEYRELMKQLVAFHIVTPKNKGVLTENRLIRINRGTTNYDIGYNRGADTYVIFEVTHTPDFESFTTKKHEDIYAEDLPNFIK